MLTQDLYDLMKMTVHTEIGGENLYVRFVGERGYDCFATKYKNKHERGCSYAFRRDLDTLFIIKVVDKGDTTNGRKKLENWGYYKTEEGLALLREFEDRFFPNEVMGEYIFPVPREVLL